MNNLWQSDKLVSKLFSLAAEAVLQARTVMLFLQGKNALLVRLLGIQEMKDYPCQLMSRCGDGLGSSQSSPHPTIVGSQIGLAFV